jgi:hypothetical protein
MASVSAQIKTIPSETSYFINVAAMGTNASAANPVGRVFNYNPNVAQPAFSTATWACSGVTSTLLQSPGAAILKDLGKTVVSSLRTFRKVQLVVSSISSGVSVGAPVGPQPVAGEEYYTGYIEVVGAFGTNVAVPGNIAPVARLG